MCVTVIFLHIATTRLNKQAFPQLYLRQLPLGNSSNY